MIDHDDRLRDLGSQLPWDRPDPARRDAVRSALLVAAAESDRRPTTRWYVMGGVFAAGALAAACVLLLLVQKPQPQMPSAARIDASEAAQLERVVTRTATGIDEVVRVHAGRVNIGVGALRAGSHVRVATHDAEVEGEGQYEVAVAADQLREVTVTQGHATIRITGQQSVFLASGQSWRAAVLTADLTAPTQPASSQAAQPKATLSSTDEHIDTPVAASSSRTRQTASAAAKSATDQGHIAASSSPSATAASSEISRTEPHAPSPTAASATSASTPQTPALVNDKAPPPQTARKQLERQFQTGMQLLKAGKAAAAARELGAAADANPDDPLAADARYFQAVALTKAGRKTEAERAFVAFLDHAPTSIRRGRAAVMLARLIAERGDTAAARAWFESALGDADAGVAAAAKAGIAALH